MTIEVVFGYGADRVALVCDESVIEQTCTLRTYCGWRIISARRVA